LREGKVEERGEEGCLQEKDRVLVRQEGTTFFLPRKRGSEEKGEPISE